MNRIATIASAFALCAACAAWGASGAAPAVIDGTDLKDALTRGLERIRAGARFTPVATLRSQLDRATCPVALAAPGTTPLAREDVFRLRRDSVLVVGSLYKCGKCAKWHTTTAAGFCVSTNGVLVTNFHVINSTNGVVIGAMAWNRSIYPVKAVLAADKDADVAVVQLDGSGFVAAPLGTTAPVGASVSVIGHPSTHFFMFTAGVVAGYYIITCEHSPAHVPRMTITADFAEGASGGPVLDERGNVVGMVESTQTLAAKKDADHDNTQMIVKNCVTVDTIMKLITAQDE